MKIILTGADGFLGWHTRARLHAATSHEVVPVSRGNWSSLRELSQDADAFIHIAGVNRASDKEVELGNIRLAEGVASAVEESSRAPALVFANSIQSGNDTAYGTGKAGAADVLAAVARKVGSTFVDVRLPNLFGEHGRPNYNSFVATFVDAVVHGRVPEVVDRPVQLLHAQRAAEALICGLEAERSERVDPAAVETTVDDVLQLLRRFHSTYETGDIPPLITPLDVELFNTMRAAQFPEHFPIALSPHVDDRGRLVEVVRAHGGHGQTFVSTSRPAITRGEHYHLSKIERFVVLRGQARISLRRLFSRDVVSFDVTGAAPCIVDMPTMWVHNITNTGSAELTTLFWANELFDPAHPDTFPEPVAVGPAG